MDVGLFKRIIDDASAQKIARVFLYLHGEPFLHPEIVEMIAYIKTRQMAVSLATNGMLLDGPKIDALLKAGLNNSDHLVFSMLGFTKDVHENVMRGVKHDKVTANLFRLLECRKEHRINGPIIETVMYLMPENEAEGQAFTEYWRKHVDHVREVGTVSKQFADYNMPGSNDRLRQRTCKNLWERMTILWNGDVTLCCADVNGDHVLGNLKHQTIDEIWNCEKYMRIKQLHRDRAFENLPICATCDW